MGGLSPRCYRREAICTLGSVLFAGCTEPLFSAADDREPSYPESWPSVQFDAKNTGAVSGHVPREMDTQWRKQPGGANVSPIVVNEKVFTTTNRGIGKYDLETGGLRWNKNVPGTVCASPSGDDQAIYVPTETTTGGKVVALRPSDGKQVWTVDLGDEEPFSPICADNTVYIRTTDGLVHIDKHSGEITHRRHLSTYDVQSIKARVDVAPAVTETTVIVPHENGVSAIDRESDERRWQSSVKKVRAAPTISEDLVVLSGVKGGLVAVDLDSGRERWRQGKINSWTSPPVTETAIYATDGTDLVKLDRKSGEVNAKRNIRGDIFASPIVVGDTLIAGSIGSSILAFDTDLQTERWSVSTTFGIEASPAVAGQRIIVSTSGGQLRALRPESDDSPHAGK